MRLVNVSSGAPHEAASGRRTWSQVGVSEEWGARATCWPPEAAVVMLRA